jgi:hypothetical protein
MVRLWTHTARFFVSLSLAFVCYLLSGHEVSAAQITCVHRPAEMNKCEAILIQGDIVRGDLQRLEAVLDPYTDLAQAAPRPQRSTLDTHVVYLHSRGGDVLEAMAMGRLIRQLHLQTEAPSRWGPNLSNGSLQMVEGGIGPNGFREACRGPDCVCASACFLVWAGGIRRTGDNLLVHRPRASAEMVRELGVNDTRSALVEIRRRVQGYLQEMEIPASVITAVLETDPGTLTLARMNPSGAWELGFIPSIVDSLTDACRIPSVRERQEFSRLFAQVTSLQDQRQPVPPSLQQAFRSLDQRRHEAALCIWRSISQDTFSARGDWQTSRSRARLDAMVREHREYERQRCEERARRRAGQPDGDLDYDREHIPGLGDVDIHRSACVRALPYEQKQRLFEQIREAVTRQQLEQGRGRQ